MIYAYVRVSTDKQDLDNQRYGIKEYAKQHNMKVDVWYEEKVSGTKKAQDRELGELLRIIKDGDTIITTEFSRIGRSTPDVLNTISIIKSKECVLRTIKENFVLDDSLSAKILCNVLAMISEIENELRSQRIKEALASKKAKGIKLGRQVGSKNKHHRLESKHDFIETMLKGGATRYRIKKLLKCHAHSLNDYLKISGLGAKYGINFNS